jgi:EAL domain-containing protein (putative c-di-GMP-specific phosphodiesterase class I)
MTAPAPSRPDLSADEFKAAIQGRQLSLHYQPIVDIRTSVVQGFEALMRWQHPVHGPISPGVFIPLAEQSGLIVDASKWALREACRALKRIESRAGRDANLYMSVNFTPSDFSQDTFIFDLYNIISESDVLPGQIQLEITEALMVNQPENALSSLTMCRKAGMKISVDDCATTRQDLGYLSEYPIDSVKIDQIYIRKMATDPESTRIVAWIIETCRAMGKIPIAEGVETEAEAKILIDKGCDFAQGYFFAKPLPEKEVTEFLLASPLRR